MFKKLLISFSAVAAASLVTIIVLSASMFATSTVEGQQSDFYNKTVGEYEVTYTLVDSGSVMTEMLESYIDDTISFAFEDEKVTVKISLNLSEDTESSLKLLVNNEYLEGIKAEESNALISIFNFTIDSAILTDILSLKLKVGAMPFEPEFSLKLNFGTALEK